MVWWAVVHADVLLHECYEFAEIEVVVVEQVLGVVVPHVPHGVDEVEGVDGGDYFVALGTGVSVEVVTAYDDDGGELHLVGSIDD